jgi:hypothetical protein
MPPKKDEGFQDGKCPDLNASLCIHCLRQTQDGLRTLSYNPAKGRACAKSITKQLLPVVIFSSFSSTCLYPLPN